MDIGIYRIINEEKQAMEEEENEARRERSEGERNVMD